MFALAGGGYAGMGEGVGLQLVDEFPSLIILIGTLIGGLLLVVPPRQVKADLQFLGRLAAFAGTSKQVSHV